MLFFNDQIRLGPSFSVPAGKAADDVINNSSDFDSEDEQSLQGGAHGSHSHSAHGSHSRRRSNKVAYVVFTGRITGVFTEWSSAEYQVKFFPGCSFKGYTTVDAAISAWDLAVANDMVGIPRSKHSNTTRIVSPTTPSRQAVNSTNVIPTFQPSTPSRQTLQTSATSLFTSSLSPERPATSSTPSTHGSETRLAAIITALNDVDLMSHYVVIRGEKPGVYSSSISARTALGANRRSLCYFVTSKEAADAKFVENSMAGEVEYL